MHLYGRRVMNRVLFEIRSCNDPCSLRCKYSKKSPTGPTEQTRNPEYLTALAIYLGVRW